MKLNVQVQFGIRMMSIYFWSENVNSKGRYTLPVEHSPCLQTVDTVREHGCHFSPVNTDREHGPCWWLVCTGARERRPCALAMWKKALSCNALFQHGPRTWIACTAHPCMQSMLVFDRPIRIFLKFSAALAADDVTSFMKAAGSSIILFDTPLSHCLLLSLMQSATPLVVCCHCQYDVMSHIDDMGQPHRPC